MRKFIGAIFAIVMLFSLSSVCFAAVPVEDDILASTSDTVTGTTTDSDGNKWSVMYYCQRSGKTAKSHSSYEISYWYGGKVVTSVVNASKSLKASATVSLFGGGSNTYGGTTNVTGSSNSFDPDDSYLYRVTAVTTIHNFSYNGASYQRTTYA